MAKTEETPEYVVLEAQKRFFVLIDEQKKRLLNLSAQRLEVKRLENEIHYHHMGLVGMADWIEKESEVETGEYSAHLDRIEKEVALESGIPKVVSE